MKIHRKYYTAYNYVVMLNQYMDVTARVIEILFHHLEISGRLRKNLIPSTSTIHKWLKQIKKPSNKYRQNKLIELLLIEPTVSDSMKRNFEKNSKIIDIIDDPFNKKFYVKLISNIYTITNYGKELDGKGERNFVFPYDSFRNLSSIDFDYIRDNYGNTIDTNPNPKVVDMFNSTFDTYRSEAYSLLLLDLYTQKNRRSKKKG